jgi:hypothetical protein
VHGEEITIMVRSILNINFKNIIFRRNVWLSSCKILRETYWKGRKCFEI